MYPGFQHFDPMDERLTGEIGLRTRHLDERELERQPRIRALSLVVQHDREQVEKTEHGGLREAGSTARAVVRAPRR